MFWDMYQDSRIRQTENKAASIRHEMDQAVEVIKANEKRLETLTVACQALWELLLEHTTCDEEVFQAKIDEIQRRSQADTNCKRCGRKKSKRTSNCSYCGVAVSKAI